MITFITLWLKKHHWMHDWGKWEQWDGWSYPYGMDCLKREVTKQSRHCKTCNKEEIE